MLNCVKLLCFTGNLKFMICEKPLINQRLLFIYFPNIIRPFPGCDEHVLGNKRIQTIRFRKMIERICFVFYHKSRIVQNITHSFNQI